MSRENLEKEGITLLGNQKVKYPDNYAPEVLDCVNIIMKDLIRLMDPKYIEVWGKFTPRGGISIDPYCNYGKAGTRWEEIAWKRLAEHDMYPEKIDNR